MGGGGGGEGGREGRVEEIELNALRFLLGKDSQYISVSNLLMQWADEPLAIPLDGLHIDDKLYFTEEPVEIMDHEVKQLKQSHIPIIKVRWNIRRGPEFTWECEDHFKRSIHISSKKPHRRQVTHLKPWGQGSFNGGRL
ncbi:hypothetical protein Tco_0951205 [Tanacetum coccineum]|uniref:Reverse transcriptase domain-containing protein n=1 Tax=Tanacetum coccineum TaxID=301880 RepID=A0ABQ5DTX0_9ASTR